MPEVETFAFRHKELIELMIKASGIHEGKWMLQINFGISGGNVGPTEEDVLPAAIIPIQNIGITRAKSDAPSGLTLDAAEVNPA